MKSSITFIFILFVVNPGFADCGSEGMRFLPEKKEISLHPWFIIEGYANSQLTIKSFKDRKVYLKTENGTLTELTLVEILTNSYISQAVFKTTQALAPNTKYYLYYANQTDHEKRDLRRYNEITQDLDPVFWVTTDLAEQPNLATGLKINYSKNEIKMYGCGNAVNAIFTASGANDTEIWFRTEMTEIGTGLKTIMYVTAEKSKIHVGKGMVVAIFSTKEEWITTSVLRRQIPMEKHYRQ